LAVKSFITLAPGDECGQLKERRAALDNPHMTKSDLFDEFLVAQC